MNVLVSMGPGYEPIDQVRRITNHSTGALGTSLCQHLHRSGHQVTCLLGQGSVIRPQPDIPQREFTTSSSLLALFQEEASRHHFHAVFHAAALGDYEVASLHDADGHALQAQKFPAARARSLSA
ncbi:MAG: hypothetical protein HC904_05700 [Blastochloris sp.]|nr:hypothetical protein [Blastochloris sp.]